MASYVKLDSRVPGSTFNRHRVLSSPHNSPMAAVLMEDKLGKFFKVPHLFPLHAGSSSYSEEEPRNTLTANSMADNNAATQKYGSRETDT